MLNFLKELFPVLFFAGIALVAYAAFWPIEPRLMQHSTLRPQACFSDDDYERGYCFGYMRAAIDQRYDLTHYFDGSAAAPLSDCELDDFGRGECSGYYAAKTHFAEHGFPEADVACFLGEVLALRNVAMWGWSEISETLDWTETEEGQARVQGQGAQRSLEVTQEFARRALEAQETVSARQAGGRLPAKCAIPLRVQNLWN